jgi:hypothetical protein
MGHSPTTEVTEMYAHLCAYDADISLMTSGDPPTSGSPRSNHVRIVK